jgi:crossover junction endodeoxyribonuclease RuvC
MKNPGFGAGALQNDDIAGEQQGRFSRPRSFAFGRARGVIEGVLAACGLPCKFITPACWKRAVGLTLASKDAARSEAIRRWPGHAALFARVKDDGRAEAALIAIAGLTRARAKGGAT